MQYVMHSKSKQHHVTSLALLQKLD